VYFNIETIVLLFCNEELFLDANIRQHSLGKFLSKCSHFVYVANEAIFVFLLCESALL
jgi:hypothetical protein